MAKQKAKMGRPPKADKFTEDINLPCHPRHNEILEAYRIKHGLRSRGEAVRQIIDRLPESKGGGK